MKILLTGASGLLGSNLLLLLEKNGQDVYYTQNTHRMLSHSTAIVLNLLGDIKTLMSYEFDVIINCVALVDVDRCEKNLTLAYALNAEIPKKLALLCQETGAHLIHISTDQVFDGKEVSYSEESSTNPINIYGKSKLLGEENISRFLSSTQWTIVRTNFFGINSQNKKSFSEWILDSLKYKKEIHMFTDVFFNPILVNTLCDIIYSFCFNKESGIFHIGTDQAISKYEFGELLKMKFAFDHPIIPISVSAFPFVAKRPKNMFLNNSKLKHHLKIKNLKIEKEIDKLYTLYELDYPKMLKSYNTI